MALTSLHVLNICNGGNQWGGEPDKICKYLNQVNNGNRYVSVCTKLNASAYEDLKKKGHSYGTGDNCQGYLYLLHARQGYDVKK